MPRRKVISSLVVLSLLALLSASQSGIVGGKGNVVGRVQQLELDLQKDVRDQLRDKLMLALDGASQLPDDSSEGAESSPDDSVVVRTGLIVPPKGGWRLLDAPETQQGVVLDVSELTPICVFAPLRRREQLEQLRRSAEPVSAHAFVSSRLQHSARMVRLAKGLVREKLGLPGNNHRHSPKDPDLRPALMRVFSPAEFADVLCLVASDEVRELSFRSLCTTYQEARQEGAKAACSVAVWGVSSRAKHNGRSLAQKLCSFKLGVEVDLDAGDVEVPPSFAPSSIPGVYGEFEHEPSGAFPQVGPESGGPFTVVTAFSKNHYTVGLRLMNSILAEGQQSSVPFSLVVWTMEKFDRVAKEKVLCMVEQLRNAKISVVVKSFNFAQYPLWTYVRHYKAGWWAWKAIMVWETFVERKGSVLWIDAGNVISGPDALSDTFASLHKQGFVGVTDSWFGMNYRWTHPGTMTFLGVDLGTDTTQCCGCLFGVTQQTYEAMLRPMFECSLTLQCLAPKGSSMANHRQDQSVLSVLAWHSGLTCTGASKQLKFKCDSNRYHCSEPAMGEAAQLCNLK